MAWQYRIYTMRSGDTRRCNFVIESRALLLFEPMDDGGVGGVGIRCVFYLRVYGRIATNRLIPTPSGSSCCYTRILGTACSDAVVFLMQILFYFAAIFLYDECTFDYFVNAHSAHNVIWSKDIFFVFFFVPYNIQFDL